MKPVRDWYRDDMDKKRTHNDIMDVLKSNQEAMKSMTEGTMEGIKTVVETIMNNRGTTNKLIKPAKVPSWCKGMKIQAYKKSLEVWMENNKDMYSTNICESLLL